MPYLDAVRFLDGEDFTIFLGHCDFCHFFGFIENVSWRLEEIFFWKFLNQPVNTWVSLLMMHVDVNRTFDHDRWLTTVCRILVKQINASSRVKQKWVCVSNQWENIICSWPLLLGRPHAGYNSPFILIVKK